jgi:hypothetical protein
MLEGRERVLGADQQELRLGMGFQELPAGRQRNAGAVVAPHAIDRDRDQRDYSS